MPKIKKILCVGSNTADTDNYCQKIASEYNIKYQGLLTNINSIVDGCYHASVADLTDSKLLSISDCFGKIIFLDNYHHNLVLKDISEIIKNIITNKIILSLSLVTSSITNLI
jgi:hypothetical protein